MTSTLQKPPSALLPAGLIPFGVGIPEDAPWFHAGSPPIPTQVAACAQAIETWAMISTCGSALAGALSGLVAAVSDLSACHARHQTAHAECSAGMADNGAWSRLRHASSAVDTAAERVAVDQYMVGEAGAAMATAVNGASSPGANGSILLLAA